MDLIVYLEGINEWPDAIILVREFEGGIDRRGYTIGLFYVQSTYC
jgi:hypothetical protein